MNNGAEWQHLKMLLREKQYNFDGLGNQFYARLLRVLRDDVAVNEERHVPVGDDRERIRGVDAGQVILPAWKVDLR